jgi:hypothetical protein
MCSISEPKPTEAPRAEAWAKMNMALRASSDLGKNNDIASVRCLCELRPCCEDLQ